MQEWKDIIKSVTLYSQVFEADLSPTKTKPMAEWVDFAELNASMGQLKTDISSLLKLHEGLVLKVSGQVRSHFPSILGEIISQENFDKYHPDIL
jgi:hypothetical protein